jgi:hypothetical protein
MPVREDGQVALGLRGRELRLRTSLMECLTTSVDLQIKRFFLDGTAYTLAARVALAAVRMSLRVALVFVLVLVFLVATVALGVM